jgi:hypothetical protein
MLHALVYEDSLKGIDLVGIKSCEGQNSQAQSIESFSCRSGETNTLGPSSLRPPGECFYSEYRVCMEASWP